MASGRLLSTASRPGTPASSVREGDTTSCDLVGVAALPLERQCACVAMRGGLPRGCLLCAERPEQSPCRDHSAVGSTVLVGLFDGRLVGPDPPALRGATNQVAEAFLSVSPYGAAFRQTRKERAARSPLNREKKTISTPGGVREPGGSMSPSVFF